MFLIKRPVATNAARCIQCEQMLQFKEVKRAVVVPQLAEWPCPIPEAEARIQSSEKFMSNVCLLSAVLKSRKVRKRDREWPILEKCPNFPKSC